MLKFKVTNRNNDVDVKSLNITKIEKHQGLTYTVPNSDFGTVNESTDKSEYIFYVKDLYNIQADSHISAVSSIMVGDDNSGSKNRYDYMEDFIVSSASKERNCFSINVDNKINLSLSGVTIETRYNAIYYTDNSWKIISVDRGWLEEECDSFNDVVYLDTAQAAYGINATDITSETANSVFYYDNDSWNCIKLYGEDLEGCLKKDNKIALKEIHEYDDEERLAIQLKNGNLYYTAENYIILNFYPTHYFCTPLIEYSGNVTERYNRGIIEKVDYPIVHINFEYYDSVSMLPHTIDIIKECYIEDNSRLMFNYDRLMTTLMDEPNKQTRPSYPIVISEEREEKALNDIFKNSSIKTTYRRLKDYELSAIKKSIFPNGYSINTPVKFGQKYNNDTYYMIPSQSGEIGNFSIKRDNFIFDDKYSTYSLMYDTSVNVIQIPISQRFETDLYHDDAIKTDFIDSEKEKSINPIIDMEKDAYSPAIQASIGTEVNAAYIDCYKIIFNLHFRKHRDTYSNGVKQEWICDKNSYWNGNKVVTAKNGKKVIDFCGRVFNYSNPDYKKGKEDYFSYFGNIPNDTNHDQESTYNISDKSYVSNRKERSEYTEYQSDILSYLGFANDDVKYQKSKLKKSFLRLLFYDSDNIGNQNLLHTATIFLDSGNLFAKYIKNINTEDEYVKIGGKDVYDKTEYENSDDKNDFMNNGEPMAVIGSSMIEKDTDTSYDCNGVRTNREPMRKTSISKSNEDLGDNIGELERLRLSSQFVVTDKFSSKRSSEGFYFYNYKSNSNGVYPSEIYMRVEFNHAGYGRTIPFMMPYIRDNERKTIDRYKNRNDKIKTFEDVAYDWSEVDIDKDMAIKDNNEIGYGSVKYLKYSYIKWKYRYDKETQKHIYYLDPEQYGESVISSNGHGRNIILNLYEGKIR